MLTGKKGTTRFLLIYYESLRVVCVSGLPAILTGLWLSQLYCSFAVALNES